MHKIITTAILAFFISSCLSAQEIFLFKDDAGKYGYCDVSVSTGQLGSVWTEFPTSTPTHPLLRP